MENPAIWVIVLIGVCIVGYFLEQFLRKKLNMEKKGFFLYKPVNSLHAKLEKGFFIIGFLAIFIYYGIVENANAGYVLCTLFGISQALRVWMEWKYDRESKEHVISLFGLFLFILMISMMFYFIPTAV
ncbi:DUF4181 domain-containing protein [Bacillus cereus]|uniref:DUF4181 domain-containing protein n=1 Tax=Bacillus cereus group TaxID=86661 RepID=UPI00031B5FEC|nr:DUF4181 domain-containing protein [Bacillus cereus]HDR4560021.1 DUF4181 domain-containing protein [Bacillus luti]